MTYLEQIKSEIDEAMAKVRASILEDERREFRADLPLASIQGWLPTEVRS